VDKEEVIREAVNIIRRHLPGRKFEIVLFGSWARGNAQQNSDIDLSVVGPEPLNDMTLFRIVDLSKADDKFRPGSFELRPDYMREAVFNSFSQSIERLAEVLKLPKTVVTRDSAIKRFELTFELAWKSAKAYLGNKGIVCQSPRDCLMEVFRLGLIPDERVSRTSLEVGRRV
jgi:predicted nucleotidyltransferase